MNVFGQEEAVHQTLGNPTPFTLSPYSYTGGHEKGLPPSIKMGCQFASNREEDAIFVLTWAGSSWIATTRAQGRGGESLRARP